MQHAALRLSAVWCVVCAVSACASPRSPFDLNESDVRGLGRDGDSEIAMDDDAGSNDDPSLASGEGSASCGDGRVSGSEHCDVAVAEGEAGACAIQCASASSSTCVMVELRGVGCDTHCETTTITARTGGDLCCPAGASAADDPDCVNSCGNGVLEPSETCDPPESCPSCPSSSGCLQVTLRGAPETCDLECVATELRECRAGDGCCPADCTSQNDGDCSARCGDGVVDAAAGETCEPASATPCPASCDDGDACTQDLQGGSDANCNVACSHTPATAYQSGDGCCPPGGNAAVDADCVPVCGNVVMEPGEGCDDGNTTAGDGCNEVCEPETREAQCLTAATDACDRCACQQCQEQNCFEMFDHAQAAQCDALTQCMRRTQCTNADCYCTVDLVGCLIGASPGPCRAEVEAAAGTRDPVEVVRQLGDSGLPAGRAVTLHSCEVLQCAAECSG